MNFIKKLARLDAFPKIDASKLHQTTPGGLATLLVSTVLTVLFLFEIYHYCMPPMHQEFVIDPSLSGSFPIKLDISVASPCDDIIIQFIDASGANVVADTLLEAQNVPFVIVDTNGTTKSEISGCRISGSFPVHKNKGKFQITPLLHFRFQFDSQGASIDLDIDDINFSHVIDHLSFGMDYPGMKNPLDTSVQTATDPFFMYQYFVSVIPTLYYDYTGVIYNTNQYAVTEYSRSLDENKGGSAGIFFSYEMEPILVHITKDRPPFSSFIVRLIGILGGIFTSSGLLNHAITALWFAYPGASTPALGYSVLQKH